jgi:hypothetical protein
MTNFVRDNIWVSSDPLRIRDGVAPLSTTNGLRDRVGAFDKALDYRA